MSAAQQAHDDDPTDDRRSAQSDDAALRAAHTALAERGRALLAAQEAQAQQAKQDQEALRAARYAEQLAALRTAVEACVSAPTLLGYRATDGHVPYSDEQPALYLHDGYGRQWTLGLTAYNERGGSRDKQSYWTLWFNNTAQWYLRQDDAHLVETAVITSITRAELGEAEQRRKDKAIEEEWQRTNAAVRAAQAEEREAAQRAEEEEAEEFLASHARALAVIEQTERAARAEPAWAWPEGARVVAYRAQWPVASAASSEADVFTHGWTLDRIGLRSASSPLITAVNFDAVDGGGPAQLHFADPRYLVFTRYVFACVEDVPPALIERVTVTVPGVRRVAHPRRFPQALQDTRLTTTYCVLESELPAVGDEYERESRDERYPPVLIHLGTRPVAWLRAAAEDIAATKRRE